ncbi:uncharacterized protein N7458_004253 [Penicillium daleae]|uniref:Uncharacterized protein n=1 Tax=Penicillium daleae TaxID=63821 RepID=A0AAD6CAP5_9EURO|nr:uncharacterized protein N7458_004253 [Penicillium daleae]KAJ5455989.1 hypothetical protein N7458_004253 [Penicillium daleae]
MELFGMLRGWDSSSQGHEVPVAASKTSNEPTSDDFEYQDDILTEIQYLHRENQSLKERVEIAEETAKVAQRAKTIAEEMLRRQNKRLKEKCTTAENALKDNAQILHKLSELQKWTECIDDGDAIEGMRRLFQRFEGWANRHFNQASSHSAHLTSHTSWERALPDYNGSPPTVHAIQAAISEQIFNGIFSRFMVAPRKILGQYFLRYRHRSLQIV